MKRPFATAAILVVGALSATGCGPGYQDLPLPGTGAGDNTYRIDAVFDDALNLAEGARVKVGGLPVGRVTSLTAEGFRAVAAMEIDEGIPLRTGTTARLRYDTPLGEVFVELTPSSTGTALADGATLAANATSTAPSVEDTLAQASLLVNGGGLTQIQTINEELNDVLGGREGDVRSVLERANTFLAHANAASKDLDALLHSMNAAATALSSRKQVFGEAIEALGPMARVLREETPMLIRLLKKSDGVLDRTNDLLDATQEDLVQILEQLGPVLEEILSVEPEFIAGMEALSRARDVLNEAVPGDFVPLDTVLRLDLTGLLGLGAGPGSGGSEGEGPDGGGGLPLLGGTPLGETPLPLDSLLGGLL